MYDGRLAVNQHLDDFVKDYKYSSDILPWLYNLISEMNIALQKQLSLCVFPIKCSRKSIYTPGKIHYEVIHFCQNTPTLLHFNKRYLQVYSINVILFQ